MRSNLKMFGAEVLYLLASTIVAGLAALLQTVGRSYEGDYSSFIWSAVLLLIQAVAAVFGYTIDLGEFGNRLIVVVNAVFVVLSILGIVTDPTTHGISDSDLAMTYIEPKKKG